MLSSPGHTHNTIVQLNNVAERKNVQLFVDRHKAALRGRYPFIADIRLARHGVDILVSDESVDHIPEELLLQLREETGLHLPVNVIHVRTAEIQLTSGDGITSGTFPEFDGTAGCIMIDNRNGTKYVLTCAHVYSKGAVAGCTGTLTNGVPVIASAGKSAIGTWQYALIDTHFDVGLVSINADVPLSLAYLAGLLGSRDVTDADVTGATAVRMHGYTSKEKTGSIVHIGAQATLGYSDGLFTIQNLIAVAQSTVAPYGPISTGGDSGSLLTDSQYVLGMVIGSDPQFTYAIPITSILNFLGLTIYKPPSA